MTSKRIDYFFDILIVLILDFLSIIFVLIPPFNQTPLRVIFALPILLFLPGYMLIAFMFTKKEELSGIERFTLSIGLSIAIFVFDGFAISVTPWRFRPMPIIISLTFITLFFTLLTLIRRFRTPEEDRYFFGPTSISEFIESLKVKEEPSDIEKALMIALIGSIIIASAMLIYAKLTFEEEKFTALYILGRGGKAEDYPSELYILEKNPIIVGVENYEHALVNYKLQVKLGDYLLYEQKLTLNHNEKWEDTVYLIPKHVGKHMKLQFILFKEGSKLPYRSVHLWVDSVINYSNLKRIREYALSDLPSIEDSEMEKGSWKYERNSNYFRGYYTEFYKVIENSTVYGYVVDANTSEPIPGARISFDNHYGYSKSISADENGTYTISLVPDQYWVSISAKGYNVNSTEINLAPEESRFLNFSLIKVKQLNFTFEELTELNETIQKHSPEEFPHTISVLRGYVINHLTGRPVQNASIRVIHDLGFVQTTRSNETGYYEVKVISGTHRIEIRAEGYAVNITNYKIGSVHELNLILIPKACKIKGFIKDKEGRPVGDVSVNARSKQFSNSTRTDITGYYEIYTIPGSFKLDVSKSGYFGNSTELNISAYETKLVNLTIEKIPPPSVIEGYVEFNGSRIPDVEVIAEGVDYRGEYFKKSVKTDPEGYFRFEVLPGRVKVSAMQDYAEEIEFYAKAGKKLTLIIQLNSNPESTFRIIYPSQTSFLKGYYAEIYQDIESREGLASLTFKVRDSYKSDRESGIFKQVLLNGHVIWEDNIAGDEGWEGVKVPVTFDEGENRISMRIYAKKDSNGPVIVEWDDVRIEPIEEILKEKTTIFNVTDEKGGYNYSTSFYLGKSENFRVRVENREQEKVNYKLRIELDGEVLKEEEILLEDGEIWEDTVSIVPDVIGDFLNLKFILFKDSEPYKHFDLWASSEIDYENLDLLKKFITDLPEIENGDFESSSGWIYNENDVNFTGRIVSSVFLSPYHSYQISTTSCNQSCFAEVYQKFSVNRTVNAVLSFDVRDSYTQARGGLFYKQVLLNDRVVWEDDVAGSEGWLHENIPLTIRSGENTLKLRVSGNRIENFPIDVWWDNIRIKQITEIMNETTYFSVLDESGGRNYPSTLYLGIPYNFTVDIENREGKSIDYILQVRLGGELLDEKKITLKHGDRFYGNVSVIPIMVGDDLLLEFILLKNGEVYRYFSHWVTSEIDFSKPEILRKYEVSIPPPVDNADFELTGGWSFLKKGLFQWEISSNEYSSGNRSLRMYQDGLLHEGDYLSAYQDAGTVESGVVFIEFSVMDDYEDVNTTGLVKQFLLNGEVIWEDDIAGSEGWQKVKIPVYFSGMNRLEMRLYAERDVDYKDVSVYWDEVDIESITGGLS